MTEQQRAAMKRVLEACEQRLPLAGQAAIIDELNALRAALAEPKRKRRTVKESLTDDGWKRTREYCS